MFVTSLGEAASRRWSEVVKDIASGEQRLPRVDFYIDGPFEMGWISATNEAIRPSARGGQWDPFLRCGRRSPGECMSQGRRRPGAVRLSLTELPMTISSLRLMVGALGAVLLFAAAAWADVPEPIPEPATTTLLALGGVGMYLMNRRRRK